MVGRVIVLNGTSSSGKLSIAAELLRLLEEPYFHMSVDDFNAMRSKQRTLDLGEDGLADVLHNTRAGFHRAAAGLARAGNNVIVDHVLSEPWRPTDCLPSFRDSTCSSSGYVACRQSCAVESWCAVTDQWASLSRSWRPFMPTAYMTSRSPAMRARQPNAPSRSSSASQSTGHQQPLNFSVVSHRRLNDRPIRVVSPRESRDQIAPHESKNQVTRRRKRTLAAHQRAPSAAWRAFSWLVVEGREGNGSPT
jgi:hypothetical protein